MNDVSTKEELEQTLKEILKSLDQSTDTWTTREGKVLKISEMSYSHLYNTVKMLERQINTLWDKFVQDKIREERKYEREYKL